VEQWRSEISKYPKWDTNTMLMIMGKESGGNPEAVNKTDNHRVCKGSYGLLQVGCVHESKAKGESLLDPKTNVQVAYQVYLSQGYCAWKNSANKIGLNCK